MAAADVFHPDLDLELIEGELIDGELIDGELIDGELIEMPADGHRSVEWNAGFNRWLVESLSPTFMIIPNKSLEISDHDEPKPDF